MNVFCSTEYNSKRTARQYQQSPKRIKLGEDLETKSGIMQNSNKSNTKAQHVAKLHDVSAIARGNDSGQSTLAGSRGHDIEKITPDHKSQRLSQGAVCVQNSKIDNDGYSEVIESAVVPNDDSSVTSDTDGKASMLHVVQDSKELNSKQEGQLPEGEVNSTVAGIDVGSANTHIVVNHNGKELEFLVSGEADMETVKQLVQQLVESGNM